ncbi:MAG: prepilin-type N-terminal cleavage/methylation domain-containing protein [Candidatus Rokubacteria bacterium]|nr:prepilin-type N-terminal cleavage/methylation domain-containing protein [Candidatus Rokubacteria bacterium]
MNERGFTLAELLVSVAVLGLVMAGVFVLQQQGQIAYLWGSARVEVQQNARFALDLMTRELRSALSITSVGANCNNTTGADTITFTDASNAIVIYALSGSVLQRSYAGTNTDIIGGVASFKVFCYNADGYTPVAAGSEANIHSLRIVVETQAESTTASGAAGAQRAIVESRVKLRNL